jgi:gas vesicle protein
MSPEETGMNVNLETLLQSLPSREDLASAVGLESRQSRALDIIPALSLFGTGMLFGAGLALLFAPKSGQEMRRDLSQTMHQYGYGEDEQQSQRSGYGERQMASQAGMETSRYQSQQDYPRQMSGQSSSDRSRQMSSQPQHVSTTPGQSSRQMSGHQTEQRSESELQRERTPGTPGRNI